MKAETKEANNQLWPTLGQPSNAGIKTPTKGCFMMIELWLS